MENLLGFYYKWHLILKEVIKQGKTDVELSMREMAVGCPNLKLNRIISE